MESNKYWLMLIGNGLWINADKNKKSYAFAGDNNFVHP